MPRDRRGDGVRSLEGVEQTAMRCKSALPRERSGCTHSHARGIVANGAMTRSAPTRQEEATTSRLKRFGMQPTGFPSKDTGAHRPSVHAQAREARPAQALTHLAPAPVLTPLPEMPPHTACSVATLRGREGLHDGSKNRRRLQTERAGEVTSQTACASSPCRSPRTGRIERQTVGELAAGVDVPRVGGGRHEASGRA